MKLKTKDKINVFKKVIREKDGIVIIRYLKEEFGVNPDSLKDFFKSPITFFLFRPSRIKDLDLFMKISKHLSKEEKKMLTEKLNQIPKVIKKAVECPACQEELEIKYGLYNSREELIDLMERAGKKLGMIVKIKRSVEK